MPTSKPPYATAFRQQMVELVRAGRGIGDMAREFGCNVSSIHAWVKAACGPDGSGATSSDAPLSMIERQELIESRRKFKQWPAMPPMASRASKPNSLTRESRQAHNRIASVMRTSGLRGVGRRQGWCVTTQRDKEHRPAPDLVQREFTATGINQLWVADMTYLPTWAGFVYLAVVLDVYSRKVWVGRSANSKRQIS